MKHMTAYHDHLKVLSQRWSDALTFAGFDAAVVAAGEPRLYFLDDQAPAFRPNPHFAQWFPDRDCAHAMLLVRPGAAAKLYFHQPRDYWHQPPVVPDWAAGNFEIALFDDLEQLQGAVAAEAGRYNRLAFVGELEPGNLIPAQHNPALLLQHLHYYRAYKTSFEIDCMIEATERAVDGHLAARTAFFEGASEFDTHMRYLAASRQTSADLPYSSIVAHNEHAGVLHYQHYDRAAPAPLRSFLIDAGATAHGYASDITRTYAAPGAETFAELIAAMDTAQQRLIDGIRVGINYVDIHEATHRAIGEVLAQQGLVRCSPEAAFADGLTRIFLPHGVGHLIGLQTHDVGGQQTSPEGGLRPPPPAYPALRLTRDVAADQVFTIEPGLYFIPMLLDEAAAGPAGLQIRWDRVNELRPYGGIRIEDNVVASADGVRNLTREVFARHE
jgi:Xaa-Pro dipeptidase